MLYGTQFGSTITPVALGTAERHAGRPGVIEEVVRGGEEDAPGRDRGVGLVVVEAELGVRAALRMQVEMREGVEVVLFGGPGIVVVGAEVDLIGGGGESPRVPRRV